MLVAMTEHPSDALQLLTTIRQRSSTVKRALVHSPKADVRELLRVAPSTELLLRYDATPIDTANHIMMALRPTQRAWSQVVLYGANSLYPELVRNGFSGLIAQDERSTIRMIEEGSPVVVIGPDATQRAELVRLLRCTPATRGATITVCYADEAERERCSRAGANLLIPENYERGTWGEQLRALAAAQDQASGVITDHGAPLPAGHRAWVLLERAIAEVQRGRGTAALATVTLVEGISSEDLSRIHNVLAEEFRHDDTIASIGPRTVAVLLRGAEMEDAVERMQRAIAKLDLDPYPGMTGIAAFPADGPGIKALVDIAISAAGRAAVSGGPAVVRSDWFAGMEQQLDVFVVESEPALGGLLDRLITKEGYSTQIVGTGSAALSALTGPDAITPPRLILLELDAMGADGMMIFRSLERAGVLRQSEIIVTCSLVNDGQLREVFELGGADVITKPFSSVVLRNRIHRVLAA